jgi:hypothetical protein
MPDKSFWMTAKRDGDCAECEAEISVGDRIVWTPEEFKAYCAGCGEEVAGEDPREKFGA